MAREEITDLDVGLGEFIAQAHQFHTMRAQTTGGGFRKYFREKVALKGNRYNTIQHEQPGEKEAIKAGAESYRRERDGE